MNGRKQMGVMDDPKAYRQQVRMPAVQVEGLGHEELKVALAYELEPSSGIPAPEAEVAFRPVEGVDPSVRVYEVAVRRRSEKRAGAADLGRLEKPALALAAVVLAALAVDCVLLVRERSVLSHAVETRAPLQAELDSLRASARSARDEAARLRQTRAAAVKAQDDAAKLRAAYPEILSEIGTAFANKAVVRAIVAVEPFAFRVRAVALSAEKASEVLVALTAKAAARGWKLESGRLAANAQGTNVEFEFGLKHD